MSRRYIEIANKRAASENVADRVRFKVADMRKIASILSKERPFDGIVNLNTSFGFYDDKTNADILRQCSNLVRPEGFFTLEIVNRDWIVCNFQERGFTRYEGLIILEDREFDRASSRMRSTWTYLVQKSNKNFVLERKITLDHRVWSLHELSELFGENGWDFKAVYPGFGRLRNEVPATEAHRFLLVAENKKTVSK